MNSTALTLSYGVTALLGILAAAFGILALVGITPPVLESGAVIALGFGQLMPEEMFGAVPRRDYWLARGALGLTAVVLGAFALFGSAPALLMIQLGVIAIGASLFVPLGTQGGPRGRLEWALRAFTGVAAIILAIVALAGTAPIVLPAVAIVILGVTVAAP